VDAGIVMIPGVGFDVIPSDCLLALLSQKISGVTHVESAVKGFDWLSRGTIKSALEFFGVGGKARIDGEIKTVPFLYKEKEIEFSSEKNYVGTWIVFFLVTLSLHFVLPFDWYSKMNEF
jgi:saccharopine dehydrogenase (NAD+, L-lysine-forming)